MAKRVFSPKERRQASERLKTLWANGKIPPYTEELRRQQSKRVKAQWDSGKMKEHYTDEFKSRMSKQRKLEWARGIRTTCVPRSLPDRICPVCNIIFRPRHSYNRICSKPCANKLKSQKMECTCIICGKLFLDKPSAAKNRLTCGKKCQSILQSRKLSKLVPKYWYNQGRRYEHKCVSDLTNMGYLAIRSRNSRGLFDVSATRWTPTGIILRLVQVKKRTIFGSLRHAMSSKHLSIIIDNIERGGKIVSWQAHGLPDWASQVFLEIWIWFKYKGWTKYRFDFQAKTFNIFDDTESINLCYNMQ